MGCTNTIQGGEKENNKNKTEKTNARAEKDPHSIIIEKTEWK